jgi:hypothetical protein
VLGGNHFFLVEPALGFLVVAVLLGLSRWTFGSDRPRRAVAVPASGRPDFGLLVAVATVGNRTDAEQLRALLADHSIRGTVAPVPGETGQTRMQVLVFRHQALTARDLLLARG